MNRTILLLAAVAALAFGLLAQRRPGGDYPAWETRAVFPHEYRPGEYHQASQRELEILALEGWELVAVTPFVYLNEARGKDQRATVTQTYPAYFFKRLRKER
jgi:hypothetical protein